MKLLSRLFRIDPREAMRPAWHRVVHIARERHWFAERGAADTVEGRFDMISAVLAVILLRLEREGGLEQEATFLTELFVEDMDGQLREAGIGDVVVGKHIGKIMSAMGGRLGAYRDSLESGDGLEAAVARNVTLLDAAQPGPLADGLRALDRRLAAIPSADLLKGEF